MNASRSPGRWVHVLVLVALLPAITPAVAGRTCEPWIPTPASVAKGLELARRTFDRLDASGAEVALVARAGQDLTSYRLRWSHMGLAWRDHPDGRWTVIHELNGCGTATSSLYAEGLGNFFLDDPFRYEALVVVPDVDTQRRLVALLEGDLPRAMHEARYNVVAYPFSTAYQNSNQWTLEVLASALARDFPVRDRMSAQAWLKAGGYRPSTLDIPAMTRLGGRLFKANVAFDDHPFDLRMAGKIDAVSVESVVEFARARGVVANVDVVELPVHPRRPASRTSSAVPPPIVVGPD